MRLRVRQVSVPLAYSEAHLLGRASLMVGCEPKALSEVVVIRRSLDARARTMEPVYILTVEVTLAATALPRGAKVDFVEVLGPPSTDRPMVPGPVSVRGARPVVVGAGPAGLFAAHQLAMAGARPLLIERGEDAASRTPRVAQFWSRGLLDPESNVLFGEGGAGLFSDGKLTARSKDRGRVRAVMELLHACGADASVLFDAEPHIGSDRLMEVVPRLRERIIAGGGEVRFRSRLEDVVVEDGRLRGLLVNGVELECTHCVLAVGHSAREVYAMLARRGVTLRPKPFAVGVRVELPQATIDRSQYGRFAGHPLLGPASFRLTRREGPGVRPCYSFCMCPGGMVIACASEPGMLTTNGMSEASRSLPRGNAAFLVPVRPEDFPAHAVPALAGVEFQRELEGRAFVCGNGAYLVPACRLSDFLSRRVSSTLPEGRYGPRAVSAELRAVLPDFVAHTLEQSLLPMLKELRGVKPDEAMLYAPETRSSSPVRIERTPDGESVSTRGLFPAGEGAGYAGGIVSSAVDGLRAAEQVLRQLAGAGA